MRFIFLMLVFLPTFAWAQVYLTERDNEVWVSSHMGFYEDKQDTLTIAHIGKATFKPMRIPLYSFGLSNSSFWLKITVENKSSFKDWLLTVDFAQHSYVDLYEMNEDGKWSVQKQGFLLPQKTRPIFHNFFIFPLNVSKANATIYLNIKSDRPCTFPVNILRNKTFISNKSAVDVYYGIYVGIFLALLIYNSLLWVGLRDITYFYYVITIFGSLLMNVSLSGHFSQFILPENPVFGRYMIELGSATLATFASLFAKSFLNIRIYSKWLDIILSIITILGALCIVGLLFLPIVWIMHVLYNILSVLVIVLLISGFVSWRHKNQYAGYYILAWLGYLVGGICRMWADQAILPWNIVTHHGTEVGSAMEVMLLSLALSSRYNAYRKDKEEAIKHALEVETEAKETLEEKVSERTQQLQEANEYLQKNEQKIREQHNLLYEKNNALEFYKEKISRSISTALIIQTAILPTYQRMNTLFKEHFVIFMPKDIVSGDFYWVHEVDGKRILLLSDCTGHGISGAFMTMISYSILNKIAELNGTDSASDMLQKLDEEIKKSLRQAENNNDYGMDAALIIIEPQDSDWCITFSGAKRPLYYITPRAELTKIEANRQSIGGFDKKNVFFKENKIVLPNETLLYFTSDGYTDQNNVYRKKYSEKKLIEYIQKIHINPLNEQKNLLQKEIENYMTETEQRDDILLLGIKL